LTAMSHGGHDQLIDFFCDDTESGNRRKKKTVYAPPPLLLLALGNLLSLRSDADLFHSRSLTCSLACGRGIT
jgi:hypothetical protein